MRKPVSNVRLCCAFLVALVAPLFAQEHIAPLILAEQGSFFVGGRDVHSDTLSTVENYPASGTVSIDQVYVRYQIPNDVKGRSLVLVHGCCLTSKSWETTPDGRMGWDEYFLRKGRPVYALDQAWRGRSAANPSAINSVKTGRTPPDKLPPLFAAGREAAWTIFRFGPEYSRTYPGMQFPIEAAAEFWKQMVPDWASSLPVPNPTVTALSELAVRLQGAVLIGHSQAAIYPFQAVALDPRGVAGIVSIEGTCPGTTGDLTPYTRVPTLILWGDYVALSNRWVPRLKGCQAFAEAVNKRGGRIELVELPNVGIRGNSHMLMQDKNNREVADWLLAWIDRSVKAR